MLMQPVHQATCRHPLPAQGAHRKVYCLLGRKYPLDLIHIAQAFQLSEQIRAQTRIIILLAYNWALILSLIDRRFTIGPRYYFAPDGPPEFAALTGPASGLREWYYLGKYLNSSVHLGCHGEITWLRIPIVEYSSRNARTSPRHPQAGFPFVLPHA